MKFSSIVSNQTATNSVLCIASSYAAIPVVMAKDEQEPKLVRPRDLSIYPDELKEKKVEKGTNWEPTIALGSIKKFRDEIVYINKQLSQVKERMYRFVQTGMSHTESFVDDLRQEKNSVLRASFVAGGGLAGMLIATRKGKFKKLVYTTIGASTAFYVGYPEESQKATKVIKRYSIVSYHLINNVTKDLTGFELPPLPTPKNNESDADTSGESKPDVKELFYTIVDFGTEQLKLLKKIILNEKDESTDKGK